MPLCVLCCDGSRWRCPGRVRIGLAFGIHVLVRSRGGKPQSSSARIAGLEEWNEATDDLGWDVAAMALAYVWTRAAGHIAFGAIRSPASGVGLIDTPNQGLFWLAFSLVHICLLYLFTSVLNTHPAEDHEPGFWQANFAHLLNNAILMSAGWGYILFNKFVVFRYWFPEFSEIFLAIAFAMFMSVTAIVIIIAGSCFLDRDHDKHKKTKYFLTSFMRVVSYVVAWAWEQAFDAVFESGVLTETEYLQLVACLSMILMPIYALYLHPKGKEE